MLLVERLKVNGSEVGISGYNITTPTDGLGQSVTIALAKPDINSIPLDADIRFEIGAQVFNGTTFDTSYASPPVIEDGKLNGRKYSVRWVPNDSGGYPGDIIEFSALSPMAEKLGTCPLAPVILYDPGTVDPKTLLIDPLQATTYLGVALLPILTPVPSLGARYVIDFCYKALGWTRVITNVINMPVDRVDITTEKGYHEAVKTLVGSYMERPPLVWEHGGTLWVIDPEEGLPDGITPVILGDATVEVDQNQTPEPLSNAVILSYNNRSRVDVGEAPHEKYIEEAPIESGSGINYTRRECTRHVTEFRDIVSDALLRTEEHEIVYKDFAYRDNVTVSTNEDGSINRIREPGSVKLISKETIENTYVTNIKTGHTRTIEALYSSPDGFDYFGLVYTEVNSLQYGIDNEHPGEALLDFSETKSHGTVIAEVLPDGYTTYMHVLEANSSGVSVAGATQILYTDKPLETIIEQFRPTSQNNNNTQTVVIDHLNGGLKAIPPIQSRIGTRSTYNPGFALPRRANVIRKIIGDDASIAELGLRRPIVLDLGNLDPENAERLARRRLARLKVPPKTFAVTQPGIDFSLRRGSIIIAPLRDGSAPRSIVTGHGINGSAIGTDAARRVQTLETLELIIDANSG